ncbi:MAG: 4a-hydroxytetrahydrobiopterin dehydratase [Planctomycetota bacterium]
MPRQPTPLTAKQIAALAPKLHGWRLIRQSRLSRVERFPDFATALTFVNALAAEAEALNHHPDLTLKWGQVGIVLTTHSAGGLTRKDFTLAARISRLANQRSAAPGAVARGARVRRRSATRASRPKR